VILSEKPGLYSLNPSKDLKEIKQKYKELFETKAE
jgi:hypothetical protein